MTSTSFQSGQSGGCGAFHSQHILACSTSVNAQGASAALRKVYASEALRVKAFVGQRKFQAPVADDFIRGLRAPGQASPLGVGGADQWPRRLVAWVKARLMRRLRAFYMLLLVFGC